MTVKILDLFSGIGGLSLAVHDTVPNSRTVGFCDIDSKAKSVIMSQQRAGKLDKCDFWDDVTKLKASGLPKVDMITAGFPCTDLSSMGKMHGLFGNRSILIKEVFRLLAETKASYVFLENVPRILKDSNYPYVFNTLHKLGFDCAWGRVSVSSLPGGIHVRTRWFLLGQKRSATPLTTTDASKQLLNLLKQKTELTVPYDYKRAVFQSFLLGNTVVPAQAQRALIILNDMLNGKGGDSVKKIYSELNKNNRTLVKNGIFYEFPKDDVLVKTNKQEFIVIPPKPSSKSRSVLEQLKKPFSSLMVPTPRTGTNTSISVPSMTSRSIRDLGSFMLRTTLFRESCKNKDTRQMISEEFLCRIMGYPKHWLRQGYISWLKFQKTLS
jgi:site-specific DNA-cytosine methylase